MIKVVGSEMSLSASFLSSSCFRAATLALLMRTPMLSIAKLIVSAACRTEELSSRSRGERSF